MFISVGVCYLIFYLSVEIGERTNVFYSFMEHESAKADRHGCDQNQNEYNSTQVIQKCNKGTLQVSNDST